MKFCIYTPLFRDWYNKFILCNNIKIIENNNFDDNIIIQIYYEELLCLDKKQKYIFYNTDLCLNIVKNKSTFTKFMLENYSSNIPKIYYYNTGKELYFMNNITNNKLIKKINDGYGARGVNIINITNINNTKENSQYTICNSNNSYNPIFIDNNIDSTNILLNEIKKKPDSIITEYLVHKKEYAGHFLCYKGEILKKVYFCSDVYNDNRILKGSIKNYSIFYNLNVDDSIFYNIIKQLNYSGFCCMDFTIIDNIIKIFEMNPRIGSSLVYNFELLNSFLSTIIEKYKIDNNINDKNNTNNKIKIYKHVGFKSRR